MSTFLGACGGGAGSSVTVLVTDAPPDLTTLQSVIISIDKVDIHVVDSQTTAHGDPNDTSVDHDNKWQSITMQDTKFDLLQLQDNAVAALGGLDLPAGKITQIRLFVDPNGSNQVTLQSGQMCPIDTSRVSRTGVKISHPFRALPVQDGNMLNVVIDFDVKNSLSQDGACAFSLLPVIKIKGCSNDKRPDGGFAGQHHGANDPNHIAPPEHADDAANPLNPRHGGHPEDPNFVPDNHGGP